MNPNILITGASRGIGKATAELFASKGCELYLTCRKSISELENFSEYLKSRYHVYCHVFRVDMGNFEEVKTLFSDIPRLDILINNAGISLTGLFTDLTYDEWNTVITNNLTSCFNTCHFAVPMMLKRKEGRIVNVSSLWGNQGASMEVAYSASKGGVNAFTKALAKELAPSNIQVNGAAFGAISTDMMKEYSEEDLACIRDEIPADRLGTPEEAANLLFSIATAPSYLTGQIITMDGGWY